MASIENTPPLKPYDQVLRAELPDSHEYPVDDSLDFLELLHKRWVTVLRLMNTADFNRQLNHPQSGRLSLKTCLGAYAWHGKHHWTQIKKPD
jgi:hypothetical protein